ncbi:MAG: helix-turn-helix domain-containing protein [Bacteroidales bacterium]|nr:helix-turn-helix domain-containing protein [Bacteroidales bacterium]
MEKDYLHEISMARFRSFFPADLSVGLRDDFFVMDVRFEDKHQPLKHPCRFDGFIILYCVKGHIRLNVNLTEFELKEGMVFINLPGNIIRVNELIETEKTDLHYVCIGMSSQFAQGVKMDMMKLFNDGLVLFSNPSIIINEKEAELLGAYLDTLVKLLSSDVVYKEEAVNTIMSSFFYTLSSMWTVHIEDKEAYDGHIVPNRSRVVFERFIKLVTEHHATQRQVGFYADKLCITPKYLSKLIKAATGRSAPDWIDQYVLLEAKNMLKYSRGTIKEIVYKLNFPNQSVFYKFFKSRTGMTPSEYRNSR